VTTHTADALQQKAARVAGLTYVLIIVLAILKVNFLESNLIVSGDDAATANNIIDNELLFRIGVASEIIMFLLVVILSLALYIILKTINKNLALTALFLRFGEAIIGSVVTILSGLIPLLLLNGKAVFETEQLHALVGLFLDVRIAGLDIVMIFMGPGGIIFCYLFLKSKYVPAILAVWGIITYSTMLILAFVNILYHDLPETISIILYTSGALFEIVFGFWLFFKGVKVQQMDNHLEEISWRQ
jgi:hypothetical protein